MLAGITYGGKDEEFRRFLDLPRRAGRPLEVALAGSPPRELLRAHGWRLADAREKSASPAAYRDYIAGARGEWSIAKNAYVALRSGWFSTRSAAYLAMGKPVVVQDTGFSAHYPTGSGVHAFTTLDEAAEALAAVDGDYERECRQAREIAEDYFAAPVVLGALVRAAGL
jgi:hypothetical protein